MLKVAAEWKGSMRRGLKSITGARPQSQMLDAITLLFGLLESLDEFRHHLE